MPRIFHIALLVIVAIAPATMAADMRDGYRPTGLKYPQIIQASDYATIEAIEALYQEISTLGKDTLSCKTNNDSIILNSIKDSKKEVFIKIQDKKPITIGNHSYQDQNTVALFTMLKKILSDLSAKNKCSGVQIDQFSTRAYKKRTVLDFDFEANIVEIDSLSNGANDEERLYTLDIVNRKESFLYSN
jgi:translation initiation factor IF-1